MTDTMELSEAIRVGAERRPRQAFRVLYDAATDATCALGAAADAIGILDTSQSNAWLPGTKAPKAWRWATQLATCPACGDTCWSGEVQSVIIHLNNTHCWTRERIADWVATLERRRRKKAERVPA